MNCQVLTGQVMVNELAQSVNCVVKLSLLSVVGRLTLL